MWSRRLPTASTAAFLSMTATLTILWVSCMFGTSSCRLQVCSSPPSPGAEEIVGEVRDEFEAAGTSGSDITVTPDGTIVNGLTPIDDVNEALDLNIESEADTIGGYVFEMLGRKPELGDEVSYDGFRLSVEA